MALKHLMEMTKADRYTADGCEALNKAREADVEDRTYKTGEISEKTGLQKQPDGSWAPPKETKYGKVQQNKEGKWGVQQKLGKGSQFIEHKNEKDASKALANYTAGYNTTERSKQDPHSNEARQIKQWNKETEKIAKGNNAERRAEHAAQFQSKPAEKPINYESEVKRMSDTLLELNLERNNKMPPEMRKAIENELSYRKAEGERDKAFQKAYAEKNRGESKPSADWAEQRDQIGGEIKGNLEAAKYYFDKAQSFSTTDPSYKTYMLKAKEYNDMAKNQADDYGFDFEEMNNRGVTHAINTYAKENTDSAPRELTGDTRLRLSQVKDKVYQIGEISQKTGLQKTANGWRPVKKGADQKWMEKKEKKTAKEIMSKAGPGRTFELKMGENGQPTLGKEVKTYETRKEAQEALKKQRAESKPVASTTGNWKEASMGLVNQAGVSESLSNIAFNMTPAWAKEHGYSPDDVNGTAAQNKMVEKIIRNQDWSKPEDAVKKINALNFGYTNWKVIEKQADKVKIASEDSLGNISNLTIRRPQSAGDAAPRQLTGDCKIRVRK